jgi:cytochrome c oxidase subunit II
MKIQALRTNHMKWLTAIVTICFSLTFLTLANSTTKTDSPRVIEITASKFAFEPNEITVKRGEEVMLILHSADANHGLVIEDLGIRAEAKKGSATEIKLNPLTDGTFGGKCAHFCGAGHGSMVFTVHVVD